MTQLGGDTAAAPGYATGGVAGRGRWGRTAKATAESDAASKQTASEAGKGLPLQQQSVDAHIVPDAPTEGRWQRGRGRSGGAIPAEGAACGEQQEVQGATDIPPALTLEGRERPGLGCTIRLRSGVKMPQMGLGGGSLDGNEGRDAVAAALLGGYRLIDTALYYGNEKDIAAGIRLAGVPRSEVFIATKLLQKAHASADQVRASLKESLKNLGSKYVDLYMIHNPRAGRIKQVWPVLQEMRSEGLIRVLGVSNFGVDQLEGMRQAGLEMPEVNQIEVHCWRQLPEVVAYHERHGIATMCMAPLARGQLFGQTGLAALAKEIGRSEAEIAIRWCLQRGYAPIPKSIRPERILLNAAEGFDLTRQQMARIRALDTGYMSCKVASPCHELPWEMVADSIPDPSVWGGRKGTGKGSTGGRHSSGKGSGYR